MGAGKFNNKITDSAQLRISELVVDSDEDDYYQTFSNNWKQQLGTLGGGNHFIEVCLDTEDTVWVTLHSGSRGIGNKIGNHYIKEAQRLCKEMFVTLKDQDLAYIPKTSPLFNEYIRDLHWAQKFAKLNRDEMMDRVMQEIATDVLGDHARGAELEVERINCHHNFTQVERHFGENVWVTRKGAIEAKLEMKGMIPGSMGSKSYIVSGLENRMSFNSAPHGAGRKFSRTKARQQFTMEDFDKEMVGIEHRRTEVLLDEIPSAYKDIDVVMENAKNLVTILSTLRQIINVKGD
jgi:tRNA-splicing ligase RtcB (3'-phosphate/5'-hydroxy nucleic acid ligase)